MPLFGYDVKEEAQEIKTELKGSRNDLLLIGFGTLVGSLIATTVRNSDIVTRVRDWYEGRSEDDEE